MYWFARRQADGAPVFAAAGHGHAVAERVATLFEELVAGVNAGEIPVLTEVAMLDELAIAANLLAPGAPAGSGG